MDNPLMPQGMAPPEANVDPGAIGPQAAPAGGPPQMQSFEQLAAGYDKLQEAQGTLQKVRGVMDQLAGLMDTVTAEDVIEGAGVLVANGLDPVAVAGLLAEMPDGGEQLAEWIATHDQQMKEREAQLAQVSTVLRQRLGTAALAGLADDRVKRVERLQGTTPIADVSNGSPLALARMN